MCDEMDSFIYKLFGMYGSCNFKCDICGNVVHTCGEDICVKDCDGHEGDTYHWTLDWEGQAVGDCCMDKHIKPFKEFIDKRRDFILEYFAKQIEEQRKELDQSEELIANTK